MSIFMPMGAHVAYENGINEEKLSENMEKIYANAEQEAYMDAVYKFYDQPLSFSLAEALARLWARDYVDGLFASNDANSIADKLGLCDRDMYALTQDSRLRGEIEKDNKFWQQSYDYDEYDN